MHQTAGVFPFFGRAGESSPSPSEAGGEAVLSIRNSPHTSTTDRSHGCLYRFEYAGHSSSPTVKVGKQAYKLADR